MKTNIQEIMSSIQGEGMTVGLRQIFIRFSGCNLRCNYCDTESSLFHCDNCCIEKTPGYGDFQYLTNPISVEELLNVLDSYDLEPIHSFSLTGGEPLLQVEFLKLLLPKLTLLGPKIYLETNGILVENLQNILTSLDIISMDIKLPSAYGGKPLWEEHKQFLTRAREKEVFVKTVVEHNTTEAELLQVCNIIASVDKQIPLVLQPVTAFNGVVPPKPREILTMQDFCLQYLQEVRVVPQTHKFLNLL